VGKRSRRDLPDWRDIRDATFRKWIQRRGVSPSQGVVARLLSWGVYRTKSLARRTGRSEAAVKRSIEALLSKLDVHCREDIAEVVREDLGDLSPDESDTGMRPRGIATH